MLIETVNLHVNSMCNLRCAYCFGAFPADHGGLDGEAWRRIIEQLPGEGVRRVTFSGGEPTLFPPLAEIIRHAKRVGLQTSIVTNGARLTDDMLAHLDMIGITLDSQHAETNMRLGRRGVRGMPYHRHVMDVASRVRAAGKLLKLNTVVCSLNVQENMVELIARIHPFKWKPLQFAAIAGGNDITASWLAVSEEEFQAFVRRNDGVGKRGVWFAPESEQVLNSTYVMVDPSGRAFLRSAAGFKASRPVLDVGIQQAVADVGGYDREAFLAREGDRDVLRMSRAGGSE
jgi:radical S-adenosyl methionine domain-containing protein 2